jgi:type II secretory pathway component GspD/PulD (secretin)
MAFPTQLRARRNWQWLAVCFLGCFVLAITPRETTAQAPAKQDQAAQNQTQQGPAAEAGQGHAEPNQSDSAQSATAQRAEAAGAGNAAMNADWLPVPSTSSKQNLRAAENAYLAGAKKLERDDLNGAEREFTRAEKLDPQNRDYAIAISVTRQHRLMELVQQAGQEKLAGNQGKAEKLLAQARAIDPQNPLVLEHSGLALQTSAAQATNAASGEIASVQVAVKPDEKATNTLEDPISNRARMISAGEEHEPWRIQAPALAGAITLQPSDGVKSFHTHGIASDVIRDVAAAFGIRAVLDDSVVPRVLDFDLEKVNYAQSMKVLKEMTNVIVVPLDESSVLVARNLPSNRLQMERMVEETIFLPESTQEQINDIANLVRTVFEVRQATAQAASGSIVVRAPQDVLSAMNQVIEELVDAAGEVLVDVKMYEVTSTRNTNGGANIPTAAGIYNVDQAATALVNANQSLVQQAIAQGLVSATASNLTIAAELIGSGLVQSSLLNSTIGAVGGGTTMTGITETGNIAFNLGLNSSETKALDDVQLRVSDRQAATFREGSRYPIVSSTYSSGVSAAASALGNKTINGVSVASLLSQYAGGSSVSVPQVTYEDLGITLNVTPTILKSGRVSLVLDMKIEALSGSTNDGNPILENRAFKSIITVGEGESALLVSNVTKSETVAMSGIPGLSELPGFQMPVTEDIQKATSQLVLMVTPHVVRRRSDLVASPRIAVPPLASY